MSVVVEGEDDGHSRINNYLQKKPLDVQKIRKFVEDTLDLPLYMHEVVPVAMRLCISKSMQLVDYMSAVFSEINSRLPASWISFAARTCATTLLLPKGSPVDAWRRDTYRAYLSQALCLQAPAVLCKRLCAAPVSNPHVTSMLRGVVICVLVRH